MKKKLFARGYLIAMLLFFYLPIVYVVFFSFNSSKSLSKFDGFSLKWYAQMFANKSMIESIYYTLIIAVLATLISTIVGTLASIGLSKSKKVLKEVVVQVNNLPIMNPEIVTAIGLMLFYTSLHIEKGFMTLLLAHIAFCIPYVMLSVTPRIRRLDPNLAEAAMDLGATPFYALRKVILPQLMPGIVAGALIAFTMSFDDFIISYFVSGNGVSNISIMVYTMSKRINPSINALSTLIVAVLAIVLIVMTLVSKGKQKSKKHQKMVNRLVIGSIVIALSGATIGLNFLRSTSSGGFDPIAEFGCNTLNVFNWGEYIGEDTVKNFEAEYNVSVNYSLFASNEEMYTKLLGGERFDVLVPSDYMIERLIQEDRLQPLDLDNIPNAQNILPSLKNLPYDPNSEYSMPYFWGSVGIVYNSESVSKEDVESQGYNVLKNPTYKDRIYLYDSERDSFMMALKALGYSMNTTNEQEIQEAYAWLLEVKSINQPVFVTDEVIDGMVNGEKDMAVVYSGDATYIQSENPNMEYFEPDSGTNIWSDAMVIPQNAVCPALANAFINYNLEVDVAKNNSEFVGYTSGVEEAMVELENSVFEGISSYVPRSGDEHDETFAYNEKIKKIFSELWIKVKAS